jgi:hypothetical protein
MTLIKLSRARGKNTVLEVKNLVTLFLKGNIVEEACSVGTQIIKKIYLLS